MVQSASPSPLLTLTGVSRRYGERLALCPVDLTLVAGQCAAVLGVNGSGKSTLLRIAAGRDTPTTGQVSYRNRVLREDDLVARTEIAVVGDMVSAYPDLTVREHLQLVAVAHGAGDSAESTAGRSAATSTAACGCRRGVRAGSARSRCRSPTLPDLTVSHHPHLAP
jgi:ABC-2 type transport system ATP-binding protein